MNKSRRKRIASLMERIDELYNEVETIHDEEEE